MIPACHGREPRALIVLGLVLAWTACLPLLSGCGCTARLPRGAPAAEGGAVQARTATFHGWRGCAQLSNTLVRATIVPQVGGRTLEYALGDYNFLFIGRDELGTALAAGQEPRYRHFGGQFAQLHPDDRWARLQSSYPPDLFMGAYELRPLPPEAGRAAVELTSPPDLATGTRITRRIELFAGCTRLRITDTLSNIRSVSQDWGIQAMLQLKGASRPDGVVRRDDAPDAALALYAPLNPKSRFKRGVRFVAGGEGRASGSGQWGVGAFELAHGILTLRPRREFAKAVVDPALPWVAFVDQGAGVVFVQNCDVPEKALVNASGAFAPYPLLEVQCRGAIARLTPGETTSLVQEWYAARCPGPVVDVTAAGVVASPLRLLKGEGRTWVAGTFGIFYAGSAAVVLQGADGKELGRVDCGPVTPLEPFVLNRAVDVPAGTSELALEVADSAGKPVGDLGRITLGAKR